MNNNKQNKQREEGNDTIPQQIHVHGNYFVHGDKMTQNSVENAQVVNFGRVSTCITNPRDAFRMAIATLIRQEIIIYKQDFAIIYQLEMEMSVIGVDSIPNMVKLIKTVPDLPDKLKPTESNIKNIIFGSKDYPNWDYEGQLAGQISHKKTVAKAYIREMARYGYKHPIVKHADIDDI